jgi:hypothetical protein
MSLPESGVRLTAEGAQQFNQHIERAAQAVDRFGSQAASGARGLDVMNVAAYALGEAIGTFIVRGFDAARNAITGFISTGWEFGAVIDSSTVALTNFLGSQEAANEALEMAQRRAARTPYAFQDYARSLGSIAAIQKTNGGELEDYLDLVERLAAANPAEGFQGATFALRQAFSGDFLSLQDRFDIPKDTINALKEAGFSVESLDVALAGLGFTSELVAKQGETLEGRWSTLKDTFTTAAGTFMAPIRDAIANSIFGLQGTLDENMPIIEARLASAGQFVADAITSFRQGWEGNWVDADIIQPAHRVAGTLGIMVRNAIDTATAAWSNWNLLVQKGKDLWNDPWVQEKIVTPLSNLGSEIMEGLIGDFDKLGYEWGALKSIGHEWNELMEAGQSLWDNLVGFVQILGVDTDTLGQNLGDMNIEMAESHSLGELLADVFNVLVKLVSLWALQVNQAALALQKLVSWFQTALDNWNTLSGAVAGGLPYPEGVTVGGVDVGGTGSTAGGGTSSAPVTPAAPKATGGTGKGPVSVTVSVNVPPNTSPRTAAAYVSDGVTQSLRSVGLA